MPRDDDNDAAERMRKLGRVLGLPTRRSMGNPPPGWRKDHPLPKKGQ